MERTEGGARTAFAVGGGVGGGAVGMGVVVAAEVAPIGVCTAVSVGRVGWCVSESVSSPVAVFLVVPCMLRVSEALPVDSLHFLSVPKETPPKTTSH